MLQDHDFLFSRPLDCLLCPFLCPFQDLKKRGSSCIDSSFFSRKVTLGFLLSERQFIASSSWRSLSCVIPLASWSSSCLDSFCSLLLRCISRCIGSIFPDNSNCYTLEVSHHGFYDKSTFGHKIIPYSEERCMTPSIPESGYYSWQKWSHDRQVNLSFSVLLFVLHLAFSSCFWGTSFPVTLKIWGTYSPWHPTLFDIDKRLLGFVVFQTWNWDKILPRLWLSLTSWLESFPGHRILQTTSLHSILQEVCLHRQHHPLIQHQQTHCLNRLKWSEMPLPSFVHENTSNKSLPSDIMARTTTDFIRSCFSILCYAILFGLYNLPDMQ